jgi:hypothetical protein
MKKLSFVPNLAYSIKGGHAERRLLRTAEENIFTSKAGCNI